MADYPTGKDNLKTGIQGTDPMTDHAELHNLVNDAVNAIQDFVGVSGGSEPNTITGAINIIAETIQAIETYLDITINDGVANPGDNPTFLPVGASKYEDAYNIETEIDALKKQVGDLAGGDGVDLSDYLLKGDGLVAATAKELEDLIKGNTESITELTAKVELNSTTINNLAGSLGLTVDVDGSVNINPSPDPGNPPLVDIDGKFDKGATNYADAKAMEDAIAQNAADITTNTNNISTNTENIKDVVENIGGSVDVDGNIDFPGGPVDISKLATKDELSNEETERIAGDTKSLEDANNHTDAEIAKEVTAREAGDSTNKSAIDENKAEVEKISNRLEALENTSLSADWKIAKFDASAPDDGELSLDSNDWNTVTSLNFSKKDNNGTEHDFGAVKVGDTIQIGVGASGRSAGSSAAYEVTSINADADGVFGVNHLASTGSPTVDFIAVVAVYPAFDPSNYATQAELQAVDTKVDQKVDIVSNGSDNVKTNGVMALTQAQYDALVTKDPLTIYLISDYKDPLPDQLAEKFNLGTGTTTLNDATVMEAAIDTNAGAIAVLDGQVVKISTDLNALIKNLGGNVDVNGDITLPDINITELATKDELGKKFDKGDTGPSTYTTAELMEAAIDTNKAAINANADVIVTKYDAGNIPDGGSRTYDNAYALEQAVKVNTENITTNSTNIEAVVTVLGGDINNIENIEIDALPDQAGNDGKFLTTDGSDASWAEIPDGTDENAVHTLENADSPDLKCTGIMTLTQAQYDALGSRNPEVLYLVVD